MNVLNHLTLNFFYFNNRLIYICLNKKQKLSIKENEVSVQSGEFFRIKIGEKINTNFIESVTCMQEL